MYVVRHTENFIKTVQRIPGRGPATIYFPNEIVKIYVRREGVEWGIENGKGRRFIKWAFDRRLGAKQTSSIMGNFRQNINRAFYIRYSSAYVLDNNETPLRVMFL